jgi:hypothetical protein
MKWIQMKDERPPAGITVIGAKLDQYINADWRWSGPYLWYWGGEYSCQYIEPDIWMRVEFPELPDSPERQKAIAAGKRDDERKARIAAIEAEYKQEPR